MSEFRKLQAKLQKIEEGFYSRLAAEVEELRQANPRLSPVQLVQLARDLLGQEAADWLSAKLEREGDAADYFADTPRQKGFPHPVSEDDSDLFVNDQLHAQITAALAKRDSELTITGYGPGEGSTINVLTSTRNFDTNDPYDSGDRHLVFDPVYGDFIDTELDEEEEEETYMPDLDRYWVYIDRPDVDYIMYHIPRSQAKEGEPRFLKVDKATGDWQTQNWKANNEPAIQQGKGTGPHIVEEDLHSEDPISKQIQSLLSQGKRVVSQVPGGRGEVVRTDGRLIYLKVEGSPEHKAITLDDRDNIKIIGGIDHYDIVEYWRDNEIDEAVVEVPNELRADRAMLGKATSDDAKEFMGDLGIDDEVSSDIVDPETGELLFQIGQTKRELMKKGAAVTLNHNDFTHAPVMSAGFEKDFEANQDAAYELLSELRDSDFYNVVWSNVADTVEDPEMMRDNDYDIDVDVPVILKRKDGQRLDDDDHDNIAEIIRAVKNASTLQNVGISYMGSTNGGTTARFTPTFH